MRTWLVGLWVGIAVWGAGQEAGVGSGGMLVGLLRLDLAPLNAALITAGFPALSGDVVVFGGGGLGGVVGGPVLGGIGFGGSSVAMDEGRRVDLELGFGGVTVEWARALSPRVLSGLGLALGGGGLDLTVRSRSPSDFADALVQPTMSQLSLGFLAGLAYFRLYFQVLDWLSLEGWIGYFLALPGNWEEGGKELSGPRLDLRAPFLGFQLGFGGWVPEEEAP